MSHEDARSQSTGVWCTNMPKDKAAWDRNRNTIYQLYILEDLTLKGVKYALETQYGFSQYRLRDYKIVLRDYFGFRKNLRSQDWQAIAIHREKRLQCGEQSDVYLYGSLLEKARVDRAVRRSRHKWKLPYRAAPSAEQSDGRTSLHVPHWHSVDQITPRGLPKLDNRPAFANGASNLYGRLSVQEMRLHVPFTQFIETTVIAMYKLVVSTPKSQSPADHIQMPIMSSLPQIIKGLGYSPYIHISEQTSTLIGPLRSTIERHLNSRAALRSMKSISARFSFERLMYLFSMMSNKQSVGKDDVLDLFDWIESAEVDVLQSFFALPLPTMEATWEALMNINDILTRPLAFSNLVEVGFSIHKGQWLKARAGDVLGVAIWLNLTALLPRLLRCGLSPNDKSNRDYEHIYSSVGDVKSSFSFPRDALTTALIHNASGKFFSLYSGYHPEKLEDMMNCLRLLLEAGAPVDFRIYNGSTTSRLAELGWSRPSTPAWFIDILWKYSNESIWWNQSFHLVAQRSRMMKTSLTVSGLCQAASLGHVELQHYMETRASFSDADASLILEVALSQAASGGNWNACEYMIQCGVDPNVEDYLIQLIKQQPHNSQKTETLMIYNCQVPRWSGEQCAPIYAAIERADLPLLKLLLEAGACPNRYNVLVAFLSSEYYKGDWIGVSIRRQAHTDGQVLDDSSPTRIIAPEKVEKVFDLLVKAGMDVQTYGAEAMAQTVIWNRDADIIRVQCEWLQSKGITWDFELEGRNLVHLAVRFGFAEDVLKLIKFLNAHGVNVHSNPSDTGYTMLHDAVRRRRSLEVVEFLMEKGADVHCCSRQGLTVLQSLCEFSPTDKIVGIICERLLEAGAPLLPKHQSSENGKQIDYLGQFIMVTVIGDSSILSAFESIVDASLCYDADYLSLIALASKNDESSFKLKNNKHFLRINEPFYSQNRSPFQAAIKACRFDMANDFLRCGANEHHITSPLVTGLQVAVEVCAQYPSDHVAVDFAIFLINCGADVNAHAGNGLNALHRAAAEGSLNTATLLLQHGADPNIPARRVHFTPLKSKAKATQLPWRYPRWIIFYRHPSMEDSDPNENYQQDSEGTILLMQPYIPCMRILAPLWACRALDLAAITGRLDMVKLLLNAGAVSGHSRLGPYDGAIDCAKNNEHNAVAGLLQEANLQATRDGSSFEMNSTYSEGWGLAL
ncbi:hypothetical protein E8E14_002242 [Neopestalotiopsis sp. 37M]|nr:hypothetical protein E8E14_002242 [Neopestalotiopsis sp. 37M]